MAKAAITKKWLKASGLDEIIRKVNDVALAVNGEKAYKCLMAGAKIIEDEAKAKVPVDTGNLRDAIFASYGKKNKRQKKPTVFAGVNYSYASQKLTYAPYAHIIELGSVSRPPRPFFSKAVAAARPKLAQVIADGLKKLLEETVK